jgi:hypothetical protein
VVDWWCEKKSLIKKNSVVEGKNAEMTEPASFHCRSIMRLLNLLVDHDVPEGLTDHDVPEQLIDHDVPDLPVDHDVPDLPVENDVSEQLIDHDVPDLLVDYDVSDLLVDNDVPEQMVDPDLLVDHDVPDLLVDHDVPDLLVGHNVPGGGIVLFAQLQVIQHLRQRDLGTLGICTKSWTYFIYCNNINRTNSKKPSLKKENSEKSEKRTLLYSFCMDYCTYKEV